MRAVKRYISIATEYLIFRGLSILILVINTNFVAFLQEIYGLIVHMFFVERFI